MLDSPPPMIVQLRTLLTALMLDPETLTNPFKLITRLEQCVGLCDGMIDQHPMLTGDYFLRYGRDES